MRVIGPFDSLIATRPSAAAMLRAVAALTRFPAGPYDASCGISPWYRPRALLQGESELTEWPVTGAVEDPYDLGAFRQFTQTRHLTTST